MIIKVIMIQKSVNSNTSNNNKNESFILVRPNKKICMFAVTQPPLLKSSLLLIFKNFCGDMSALKIKIFLAAVN